jgi:hypothetical protein
VKRTPGSTTEAQNIEFVAAVKKQNKSLFTDWNAYFHLIAVWVFVSTFFYKIVIIRNKLA